jgi:hypothetical protein
MENADAKGNFSSRVIRLGKPLDVKDEKGFLAL